MNEDASGSITALQAEIRRLREELEKARGETTHTCIHVVTFELCWEWSLVYMPLVWYEYS